MNEFEFYKSVAYLIKTLPPELRDRHYGEARDNVERAYNLHLITTDQRQQLLTILTES